MGETWRGYVARERGTAGGGGVAGGEQGKGGRSSKKSNGSRLSGGGGGRVRGEGRNRAGGGGGGGRDAVGAHANAKSTQWGAPIHEQEEQEARQKRTTGEKGQKKEGGGRARGRVSLALKHAGGHGTDGTRGTGIRAARARGMGCDCLVSSVQPCNVQTSANVECPRAEGRVLRLCWCVRWAGSRQKSGGGRASRFWALRRCARRAICA